MKQLPICVYGSYPLSILTRSCRYEVRPSERYDGKVSWECNLHLRMFLNLIRSVPPKPHFVPAGDGLTKSASPTFAPYEAAALEDASPPEPPPITKRS